MIKIKTEKEIKIMSEGGKILAKIMEELKKKVEPGVATKELNKVAENLIFEAEGQPAFKGHEGFPATLCVSVNETIVHGVPSDYKLKKGDILSLDLGIKYKDFFTDMAMTMPIGDVDPEVLRLIEVTKKSLEVSLEKATIGNTFGDVGEIVQRYVEEEGFNVVRELCGHGIGRELHEDPQIFNYDRGKRSEKLIPGMVFCIEPMETMGDWHLQKSKDGFGCETKDGSLSAHFEHTIALTRRGPLVLTEDK